MDLTKKLSKELLETIKDSKNFLKEELPQVAQEILKFDFIINIVYIIVIAILVYAGFELYNYLFTTKFPLKECGEYYKSCNKDREFGIFIFFVISGCLSLLGGLTLMGSITQVIQIKTAPRYYLVEKLNSIVREN